MRFKSKSFVTINLPRLQYYKFNFIPKFNENLFVVRLSFYFIVWFWLEQQKEFLYGTVHREVPTGTRTHQFQCVSVCRTNCVSNLFISHYYCLMFIIGIIVDKSRNFHNVWAIIWRMHMNMYIYIYKYGCLLYRFHRIQFWWNTLEMGFYSMANIGRSNTQDTSIQTPIVTKTICIRIWFTFCQFVFDLFTYLLHLLMMQLLEYEI